MTKKDLARVKRNIKHDNDALLINGIGIFHINAEKKVTGEVKKYCNKQDMVAGKSGNDKYWNLKEENIFIDIAKKTLSGKLEETLTEYKVAGLPITSDLDKLMSAKMEPQTVKSFVEYLAEKLEIVENYSVMVMMCELIERTKDGNGYNTTDDDLCDEAVPYNFMIVSICQMKPISIGIYYDISKEKVLAWPGKENEVAAPIAGFVYPSMNDNETDYKNMLVMNKNLKNPLNSLVSSVIGCKPVITPVAVRKAIETIVDTVVEEETNKKELSETVINKIVEIAEDSGHTEINQEELEKIINDTTETPIDIDIYKEVYKKEMGNTTISTDIIEKSIKKKSADIIVNVKTNQNKVTSRMLEGKRCLVIELDETVEVKGFNV